jgi:hypothetical protein
MKICLVEKYQYDSREVRVLNRLDLIPVFIYIGGWLVGYFLEWLFS